MAILYFAATGSNTSPYDTWAKAANELTTAVTAASSGDTIYGVGTFGPYNQINIVNKTLTIIGVESLIISINAAQHGFYCSGTGTKNFQNFTISGGGDASHHAFYNDATVVNLTSMKIDGYLGNPLYARNGGTGIISKSIICNCNKILYFAACTYIANYCLFYNNGTTSGSIDVLNAAADITLNNCIIFGNNVSGGGNAIIGITGGALTINNSMIFGNQISGTANYILNRVGGTFTVNNSLVQGPVLRPSLISTGTITFNNSKLVDTPSLIEKGKQEGYVSFAIVDSNHLHDGTGPGGVGTSFNHYLSVFNALGAHFTYYMDDEHQPFTAEFKTQIQNGVLAGHDIGLENSDSSDLNQTVPFTVSYGGGEANPRIVITYVSNNNVTLEAITDAGTDLSLDIGKGQTYEFIGATVIAANSVTKAINDHADWTVTCFDGTSFDDTYSFCLEAGTINIVGDTDIPLDQTKWYGEHITVAKTLLESFVNEHASISGWEATSFYYFDYSYNATARAVLAVNNFNVAMSGATTYVDLSNISDMLNIDNARVVWTYFNDGGTEETIRRNARTLANIVNLGMWITIVLEPAAGSTEEELNWFIGELQELGVPIKSHAEMAAIFADAGNGYTVSGDGYTKTLTNNYNFRINADSVCRDTGKDVSLTTDFEGKPVPMGSAPDIGAYEIPVSDSIGLSLGLSGGGGRMIPPRRRRR